jgi:hypothetical protein
VKTRRTYMDARVVAARQAAARETARLEAEYRAGRVMPHPDRITAALDLRCLDGPEVDRACLAEEPAVDQWEAGEACPTWEQLVALADLTGFRPAWFVQPGPALGDGPGWLCGTDGCTPLEARPVVPPYRLPAPVVPLRRSP